MPSPTPSPPSESDLLATRYPLPATSPGLDSFLAELLADQQKLQTPVTRAATAHELQPSAWRAERFRELIPLTAPAPGQQYAFEVDLDSCSGCKACVSGCHSLNGLDDEETWRDVGIVHAARTLADPFSDQIIDHKSQIINQTVTTACHHCADPACLNGCPVLAYEKDPVTGIVRHLDDQCIGCSYCILKCPYDVPKYNERLGIVRKCDMCHGRLAAGEAPACAQACPTQAIKIVLVPTVGSSLATTAPALSASAPIIPHPSSFIHSAILSIPADPAYTRPTTRYVSKNPLPATLRAADADTLRAQPAHFPLVLLLVGTQLALGLLLASLAGSQISNFKSQISAAAAALFFAALAASILHLGQPLRAWRIFLGLRRSWLSREAVLLGAAAPLVALTALIPILPLVGSSLATTAPALSAPFAAFSDLIRHWSLVIGHSAVAATAAGVVSSAMLYIDTRRHFWRPSNTFARMAGTVLIAALAWIAPPAAALALALKLLLETALLRASPVSARLHSGPLRPLARARLALAAASSLVWLSALLPNLWPPASTPATFWPLSLGFLLFTVGETLERTLYFRATDAPKMPGLPAPAH